MRKLIVILILGMIGSNPCGFAEEQADEEPSDYRYGSLRLGGFWITRFDTSIVARSQGVPFGIFIDFTKDLGLADSASVPRAVFSYRFSRRHQINFDYFAIDRDQQLEIGREIEIGDLVLPIGVAVSTQSTVRIYKGVYTWLFYDNPKVSLGASAGLNVVEFSFAIEVDRFGPGEPIPGEKAGVTAPLPVLGFRVIYRPTAKTALVVASDTLLVEYGDYSGTYLDTYALFDYRFSRHFSVGGGVNFLNLDVDVDRDETILRFRHNYRGIVGFVGVHF